MSDDLDIRYGGALAVDTAALRAVGGRLRGVAGRLSGADEDVAQAQRALMTSAGDLAGLELAGIRTRIDGMRLEAEDGAAGIALMADAYELVELRTRHSLLRPSAANGSAVADLQYEIARLEASDPRIAAMADELLATWEKERFAGLVEQSDRLALLLPMTAPSLGRILAHVAVRARQGVVPPGAVLQGTVDPVALRAVPAKAPSGAPAGLADSLRRFPKTPGAQVRVERYTMPNGTRQFVTYVVGTRSSSFGGADPWDLRSNLQLYANERSASYQATLDALAEAGVRPGEKVHAVGHSQGGMIVSRLATEGPYDVATVITAGDPIEPSLDEDVLSVQLRHTDDPISALAAGGSPNGTGAPDSFVVQREADPIAGPHDAGLPGHQLRTYVETATMADASGDARVEAMDALWDELGTATEIEATDFIAERKEAGGRKE